MTGVAGFANIPRVCGALIAADLASMVDLKERLTLEEAYELLEVLEVRNYHSWLAAQRLEKENG